jgi:hypothetical protein
MEVERKEENHFFSKAFFGFYVPKEWAPYKTEMEYFDQFMTTISDLDLTCDTKNKILGNVIQESLQISSFRPDTLERFRHLMYPTPLFTPRPYLFSHEYPSGGVSLFRPIEFDILYNPHHMSRSCVLVVNDHLGQMTAMFDTSNGVVYTKRNDQQIKMKIGYFTDDTFFVAETPEWHRLPVREDLFGYRAYRREVIAMKICKKSTPYKWETLTPSFRTEHGTGFTETMLGLLLEEMQDLNQLLWNCRQADSTIEDSICFFQRYLELIWFVHNYVNFNISLHYSMWKEI